MPRVCFERREIATPDTQAEAMERMCAIALDMTAGCRVLGAGGEAPAVRWTVSGGVLLNPPNLPGWSGASWTERIAEALGAPAYMENDANACALAEWRWGRGPGLPEHGLSHLWDRPGRGADSGRAAVPGRLRHGGRAGTLAAERLRSHGLRQGGLVRGGSVRAAASVSWPKRWPCASGRRVAPVHMGPGPLTARVVAQAAGKGDPLALEVLDHVARQLGARAGSAGGSAQPGMHRDRLRIRPL